MEEKMERAMELLAFLSHPDWGRFTPPMEERYRELAASIRALFAPGWLCTKRVPEDALKTHNEIEELVDVIERLSLRLISEKIPADAYQDWKNVFPREAELVAKTLKDHVGAILRRHGRPDLHDEMFAHAEKFKKKN